ncbi:MAG: M42 family metallopeptidase [Anaerolineae bacterium]|nr:M42 family metallopeptidase [Anaerolineae bacterium]
MDQTERLLKELSEAHGVPGYEGEVRALVRRLAEPVSTIEQDRIGSLICRQGQSGPRVMLAAHLDEIGFMVHHVGDDGMLRFLPLGGWWDQVLLGQRVTVKTHKGDLTGVIGAKPPHLLPPDERKKLVERKDMYIDIGATSKETATEAGVRPGDPVVPVGAFEVLAGGKAYMGKAFDDRAGVALMLDLLQHFAQAPHPNVLYAVGTVMEEVGTRGAKTSAELVDPDVALILEVDLCGDLPGIQPQEAATKLGGGPSLWLLDARMIPNLKLRDLIIETAGELGIPLQFSAYTGAAADGAMIHMHHAGVPTVVLGVPVRHVHSQAGIMHRDDYDNMLKLLIAVVGKLDAETVAAL